MDTSVALSEGRRRRRKHSAEFKAHIVAACSKPGVSSASVAMANGVNANLVRRWVKDAESEREDVEGVVVAKRVKETTTKFVPLPLPSPAPVSDIRVELQRGAIKIAVTWPATAAAQCAAWMRELLQ
jgi:transposase-like protein